MSADDRVWSARSRLLGSAVPVATVAIVGWTMVGHGAGLDRRYLAVSWQLVDLPVLVDDPIGSVWYLHVQPPLFNLVVGSVLRWWPFAPVGTLFLLYLACLAATGVLLVDLLGRWGVHPALAAPVGALAVAVPGPLTTIVGGSYEVPVATMVVAALWLVQRHVATPRPATLLALAGVLTALVLTRSLFHVGWALAVLGLVAVARPPDLRVLGAALAVPIVLVGGWTVKNQVLFGEATTSSWFGFNLQRGVIAPMDRSAVQDAVADGAVTSLARAVPWESLDRYPEADGCRPDDRHPAVSRPLKVGFDAEVANFNNTCYLPLYEESAANARTLLRREPGRYLATRSAPLTMTFRLAPVGFDDPQPTVLGTVQPRRTWMDRLGTVVLAPVPASISLDDWNIPLVGVDRIDLDVSLTLVAGFLVIVGRGALAVARLARAGWRERAEAWPAREVTWVVLASVVGLVVVASALVEFGENERFRAAVDPLLVAAPLALAARAATARIPRLRGPA